MYEIYHLIFVIGWISDFFFALYSIINLYKLNYICLLYPSIFLISFYFEKLPFFDYICELYIKSFISYFKYIKDENLTNQLNEETSKKQIFLLGPHGIFITSLIAFGLFRFSRETMKSNKLFVATPLTYNPILNIFSKIITNGNKLERLSHSNIIKHLKENHNNITLSIGGYEEINLYGDKNVIYIDRWNYWVYHAIKYNYDITFCYLYGGTQDYRSLLGSWNLKLRLWLAKNYIPFNILHGRLEYFGLVPFNDIELKEVGIKIKLPYIPNITKKESEFYIKDFHEKIFECILKSTPSKDHHEFQIMGSNCEIYN